MTVELDAVGAIHPHEAIELTLLTSAARTATPTASLFESQGCRGIRVVLDITAVTATPSLVVTIDVLDPASGKWITLLTSAAKATVTTTALTVAPGIAASANVAVNDTLSRHVRVTVTHGDSDSATYTLGAVLIP